MKCTTCKTGIIVKRQRHQFLFCSAECLEDFTKNSDHKSVCKACRLTLDVNLFLPKKNKHFYFSEVCTSCKHRKPIRKVVLILVDKRESLSHTDVTSVKTENGLLRIVSKKDGKEYLYPLVNLLKAEILY